MNWSRFNKAYVLTAQTKKWTDWNWNSVIVSPLAHLKNACREMGGTVIVNRV